MKKGFFRMLGWVVMAAAGLQLLMVSFDALIGARFWRGVLMLVPGMAALFGGGWQALKWTYQSDLEKGRVVRHLRWFSRGI